jgi:hypothetical protein
MEGLVVFLVLCANDIVLLSKTSEDLHKELKVLQLFYKYYEHINH